MISRQIVNHVNFDIRMYDRLCNCGVGTVLDYCSIVELQQRRGIDMCVENVRLMGELRATPMWCCWQIEVRRRVPVFHESISDMSRLRTDPSKARPASGECLPMYAAKGLPELPTDEERDPERLRPGGAEPEEERKDREGGPRRVGVLSGDEEYVGLSRGEDIAREVEPEMPRRRR